MSWRLISYEECDPAFNMAADEAILEAHLAGEVPPTLRLYGWSPNAISIGYSQKISDAEIKSIRSHDLDIVRRATGGRAVLHLGDLTYSFVGTSTDGKNQGFLSTSVVTAYKQICEGLIEALKELGVSAQLGTSQANYRSSYDCFRATTNADLQFDGKKLIGSAQLRRKNGVLQHGSLLLNQGQNKMNEVYGDVVNAHRAAAGATTDRHANLFEILGRSISFQVLQQAMKKGFENAFSISMEEAQLTEKESARIAELKSKYQILQTV